MMVKDSHSVFERIYKGMNALSLEGTLSQRLEWANQCILPLSRDDFPEAMRDDFSAIVEGITAARDSGATKEDRERLAEDYLELYTKAARLDGTLQDVIGGPFSD